MRRREEETSDGVRDGESRGGVKGKGVKKYTF